MKPLTKSEWFRLDKPIGEPDLKYPYDHYDIERIVKEDGTIIWFGQAVNWLKEPGKGWTVLARGGFVPCPLPIYEELYIRL